MVPRRANREWRLADEYDAAQERGEVQRPGGDRVSNVPERNNAPTVADLGLTRKQIHEARQIRDAEEVEPGIVSRTRDPRPDNREEPTRAALREAVINAATRGWGPTHEPETSSRGGMSLTEVRTV